MIEIDVAYLNLYRVDLCNRLDPIHVCALTFNSAIKKVNRLINQWEDSEKYSIVSITLVGPCLN